MRDEDKQQLSALVDDELNAEESRAAAELLSRDPNAREQVSRDTIVRHALQGSLAMSNDGNARQVAAGVASALEAEPPHNVESLNRTRQRWLQPVAGLAVAAGVAALTIALWPAPQREAMSPSTGITETDQSPAQTPSEALPVADAVSQADRGGDTAAPLNANRELTPETRQRLNSYMVNHSEHAASGGVGGVLTYVRIAGQNGHD